MREDGLGRANEVEKEAGGEEGAGGFDDEIERPQGKELGERSEEEAAEDAYEREHAFRGVGFELLQSRQCWKEWSC